MKQPNLTNQEKTSLKECVLKYAHLVENKKTDAVSNKQKNEGWEKIAAEMRAQPGVLPQPSCHVGHSIIS
ncbi:hypothetical protein M8J75_001472 [Diaphorina citri]|nr:hypothetical protein M8J75_001472 [Diaphorina citri]